MKKLFLPLLAVLSILMLAACGGNNGPEQTVDNFMKSYKDLKLEEAGEYLTAELENEYRETLDEEGGDLTIEDVTEMKEFDDFKAEFKSLTGELKYKIIEENIDGETAEVEVDLTYADASEPLSDSLGEIIGGLFGMMFTMGDMTEEEANEELMKTVLETITNNLNGYDAQTKETNGLIKLSKENDEWVITEFDDNVINALAFGLIEGMEDFNPFSFDGEPIEMDFEVNFEDFEVNEEIVDDEDAE